MSRSCCCTGYLTNPGGRCCMDGPAGHVPWQNPTVPGPIQDGWRCPVCGTVNAPWMPTCMGNHVGTLVVTTTSTKETE